MNWFLVPPMRPKPKRGRYSDWKHDILRRCGGQCVYCTISEGEYGGSDNFHVEHFRPKSLFAELENEIDNLFSACAICNRFKGDEWPGEPDESGRKATFLDPSVSDYHAHIEVANRGVILVGKTVAGAYIVERLFLNREQLLTSRRIRVALLALTQCTRFFSAHFHNIAAVGAEGESLLKQVSLVSLRINLIQAEMVRARPYLADETKRPKKPQPRLAGC